MDVDERVRTALPPIGDSEPDAALLRQVMAQPVDRGRRRPRVAIPAVAVAALAAAAFVLLGGDRPETAAAISQAMRWFDPPAGTVLHSAMIDDAGNTREFWQDIDHPERSRIIEPGGYEIGDRAIYDPATNTIYMDDGTRKDGKGPDPQVDSAKRAKLAREGRPSTGAAPARVEPASSAAKPADTVPPGDPIVAKVRVLIADHRAAVVGREEHDGVQAWKITLTDAGDRDPWVLWVRADDGKPLAIDDPGNPARNKGPENLRWTTYEVLDRSDAPLTVRDAHPDARVTHDPEAFDALLARMESR